MPGTDDQGRSTAQRRYSRRTSPSISSPTRRDTMIGATESSPPRARGSNGTCPGEQRHVLVEDEETFQYRTDHDEPGDHDVPTCLAHPRTRYSRRLRRRNVIAGSPVVSDLDIAQAAVIGGVEADHAAQPRKVPSRVRPGRSPVLSGAALAGRNRYLRDRRCGGPGRRLRCRPTRRRARRRLRHTRIGWVDRVRRCRPLRLYGVGLRRRRDDLRGILRRRHRVWRRHLGREQRLCCHVVSSRKSGFGPSSPRITSTAHGAWSIRWRPTDGSKIRSQMVLSWEPIAITSTRCSVA